MTLFVSDALCCAQVRVLEAERLAALQTAATARQEVSQLQEARRRLEWQSQLLEKMSKVSHVVGLPTRG